MRVSTVISLASVFLQTAKCHYTFGHFLVNDTETPTWKYVRDVDCAEFYGDCTGPRGYEEFGKTIPYVPGQKEIGGPPYTLRCGRKAEQSAGRTETARVIAGSEVGFRVRRDIPGAYKDIGHHGPLQAYLQRSDDLTTDIGDGEWFKIAYRGPFNDTHWPTWVYSVSDFNFTIPITTPPGTYLLRMECLMPFAGSINLGYSQWYVNCAHVEIIGPGGGTPGPTIRIPDFFRADDPGINMPEEMNGKNFDKYISPGPPVWRG